MESNAGEGYLEKLERSHNTIVKGVEAAEDYLSAVQQISIVAVQLAKECLQWRLRGAAPTPVVSKEVLEALVKKGTP